MERILVVDDEKEVCSALKEFLEIKGYAVQAAQNGPDALEIVAQWQPHIVLLDIIMPGMSGIEVLHQVCSAHPNTGVIMITAVTDEALGNDALKNGADDFITKPVDLDYLEAVLMVKIVNILG
ncbi:MAG: response regulator [Pseudomonadota bacterium]